jgi:hypothetical protein
MGRCIIVCSNADIIELVFLGHGRYETLGLYPSLSYKELQTQKSFGFKTMAAAQHNLWWQHHSTHAIRFFYLWEWYDKDVRHNLWWQHHSTHAIRLFYLREWYDKDKTYTSQIKGLILQYGSTKLPKYALSERIIMSHLFLWILTHVSQKCELLFLVDLKLYQRTNIQVRYEVHMIRRQGIHPEEGGRRILRKFGKFM